LQSTPSRGEQGSVRIGFVSKLYSATAQSKHLSASIIQDVSPPANNNSNSNNNHLHHNNFNKNGGNGGASIISEMDGDDLTLDSALLVRQTVTVTVTVALFAFVNSYSIIWARFEFILTYYFLLFSLFFVFVYRTINPY
jgi:hypothetical protein